MAECMGAVPLSTKVDKGMDNFLEAEAEQLGTTKAELLRRLLDFYRESTESETRCPDCDSGITISLQR